MHWTDVAWPAMGAASLTLGLIHLVVWLRQPALLPRLFLAIMAIAVFATSIFEHLAIRAGSAAEWAELLRWQHVPVSILLIAMCAFVHWQFPHSSRTLFFAGVGTRLLALALNFAAEVNLNYVAVESLDHVSALGGDAMPVPVGRVSPLMAIGQGSVALMVLFLAHALFSGWRTADPGTRSLRLRVIGALLVYLVVVDVWRLAVVFGWMYSPDVMVPGFLLVAAMITYELADELLRSREIASRLDLASARLEENEATMAAALDAARVGLWSWRPRDDRLQLSDLGRRLLGDPDAGFTSDVFLERVHPHDRARFRDALDAALRDGVEFSCDFRTTRAGERSRWLALRGRAARGPNGTGETLIGVIGDVTERKEDEEMFQLVVDASPSAMLMMDADRRVVLANRRAEAVFGYAPHALVGVHADALLQGVRRDGTVIPVEVELTPIHRGDSDFVLASVTDTTERRRIEQEAALRREELAHLSRVALLSELSGSLAHELNQPLTAILSNAQAALRFMSQQPPDLGEVVEILENIVESDKRAGDVIRKLRAMLRKDTGEFRTLEANDIVSDVMRITRSDILNRAIRPVLDLSPEPLPIRGDAVTLQQVLLNLVTNACDAMAATPAGDRIVTIRTRRGSDGSVAIAVEDRGAGIPEADLERIFAPFVTTKHDGLGLGLSVCASIIGAHRGRLWATNNPDRGATLHVELPAASSPD